MTLLLQILKHFVSLALLPPTGRRFPVFTFRTRGDGFVGGLDFWSEVLISVARHVFSLAPVTPENGLLNTLRL
jgi:hypothetical protein